VTDVNEAPKILALSKASIAEGNAVGAAVGTLSTIDPDAGDNLTYTLVSSDGPFSISGNQLRATATLDFESRKSFQIRVKATDRGGLSVENQFTITVTDVIEVPVIPLPVITVAVSPASVNEDGMTNLVYTFRRTGPTTQPLLVKYNVSGTATLGVDYTGIAAAVGAKTVKFAPGSATATVTVDPTKDATPEPNEDVTLTLVAGAGYTVGAAAQAKGTINNDDFPTITLAVSPGTVEEDGMAKLVYTFQRTGPTAQGLVVQYKVSGTATLGVDYTGIPTAGITKTVTFAAGSAKATVAADPTKDATPESHEDVILTLVAGSGYTVGTTAQAKGRIKNDDVVRGSI